MMLHQLTPLERALYDELMARHETVNLARLLEHLDIDYPTGWSAVQRLAEAGHVKIDSNGHGAPLRIVKSKEK